MNIFGQSRQRARPSCVPDDGEHFTLLSVGLDQPWDDLETGAVRRTPTLDESSVDPKDHQVGRFIRFSILGNFPLNLPVLERSCDS